MLNLDELKIECFPYGREMGGMHTNMSHSGVQITHVPTGTVARSEKARSQHLNKAVAMNMLEAALTHPYFA